MNPLALRKLIFTESGADCVVVSVPKWTAKASCTFVATQNDLTYQCEDALPEAISFLHQTILDGIRSQLGVGFHIHLDH